MPQAVSFAIAWPDEILVANGAGHHQYSSVATIRDAFALTVFINRKALVAELDKMIDSEAGGDARALTAEARRSRIAEIEAALLALQRSEETMIEKMEAQGQTIARSCRIPEVLLGVVQANS